MAVTPRHPGPDYIERDAPLTLALPVYDAALPGVSSLLAPSTGTFQLKRPDGSDLFAVAKVVTVAGGVNTVPILAADTAAEDVGDRWREVWALTINGVVETFHRTAYLCRYVPRAVITDADLDAVVPGIARYLPDSQTTWDKQRVEAFHQLQARLIGKGNRPNLIMDSWALRTVHLYWTLFLIAELLIAEGIGGAWRDRLDRWSTRVEGEWGTLSFEWDDDDDDTPDERQAAKPTMLLMDL